MRIVLVLGTVATAVAVLGGVPDRAGFTGEEASAAHAIVREFYQHLLSSPPEKCPRIFVDPETFFSAIPRAEQQPGLDPTAQVWSYLKQRKQLFLFAAIDRPETLNRLRLRFLLADVNDWRTRPTIVASHTLSVGGHEGIFEQIGFPLERSENGSPGYAINIAGLTVNGILLDPKREFDRSKDLYGLLGFN